MLGFDTYGSGAQGVIVLNDWIGDVSANWRDTKPYLDTQRFTWAFADLRGYGRSRGQSGAFTVTEAAADVLALADSLGWQHFAVVGHSMSCLVALHLAQHHAARIERVVLLTPPPPAGFGADEGTQQAMRGVALGDDAKRLSMLQFMWGDRLSPAWKQFKVANWRAGADPEAAAAYVYRFARDGLPEPSAPVTQPLLVVTGEQDSEPLRSQAVTALLTPLAPQVQVVGLADVGHYPMQETPPLLAAMLERFLSEEAPAA